MSGAHVQGRPPSQAQVDAIFARRLKLAMAKAEALTVGEVVRRMPKRSGTAARATFALPPHVTGIGKGVLRIFGGVGNPLGYVGWLEGGTGIYGPQGKPIVPRQASVLRWPDRGHTNYSKHFTLTDRLRTGVNQGDAAFLFRPSVRGIQPMHMFRDAALTVRPHVKALFVLAAKEIGREVQLATGVRGRGA